MSTGSKKSQLKIHDHGQWQKQDHGSRVFVIQKTLDEKIMYDLMVRQVGGSGKTRNSCYTKKDLIWTLF